MGSQKPIIGAVKPDLVAVILERSCAQQLALALAWALGSTGGGKTQTKGGYPGATKDDDVGRKPVDVGRKPKAVGETKKMSAKKSGGKAGAKKSAAKKSGSKKSSGK